MKKKLALNITILVLITVSLIMIYLGLTLQPKPMLPPIFTGIGFLAIAFGFNVLKNGN